MSTVERVFTKERTFALLRPRIKHRSNFLLYGNNGPATSKIFLPGWWLWLLYSFVLQKCSFSPFRAIQARPLKASKRVIPTIFDWARRGTGLAARP
jgi:hypothetical protein